MCQEHEKLLLEALTFVHKKSWSDRVIRLLNPAVIPSGPAPVYDFSDLGTDPVSNAEINQRLGIVRYRTRQQSRDIRDSMTHYGWAYRQLWRKSGPVWCWVRR